MSSVELPWRLVSTSPSGTLLELAFEMNTLMRRPSAEITEGDDSVEIRVRVEFDPPEGRWFAYGDTKSLSVELERPLGHRKLFAIVEDSQGTQRLARTPEPDREPPS